MENSNEVSNENVINLVDIFFILRKNAAKMVIAALVFALIMFGYTKTLSPVYQSNAKMVLKVITSDTLTTYSDVQIAVGLVNDCVEIIRSRQVMQEVIDRLGLDCTPDALLSGISLSVPADTRVIKLSVNNTDPELAKKIAEQICDLSESMVASNVGVDSINTFEKPSTPLYPVAPNAAKNTILGAFIGAFAVAAYEILKKVINNKIYTPEDIEHMLGLSVFAAVPYIYEEGTAKKKAKAKAHEAVSAKGENK